MNTRLAAPGAAGAPGVVGAKPMPFKAALPRYFACKVLNAILSPGSNWRITDQIIFRKRTKMQPKK